MDFRTVNFQPKFTVIFFKKSPQTRTKLLSPNGSSFACRTENLMLRLLFSKMFSPKVHFSSKGISGSKCLPQHQPHRRQRAPASVADEQIQLLWFHRRCCCDKSICRRGCFLWEERACFLGTAAKFIFKWRKLRFKAANLSAVPGCPKE